MLIKWLAPVVLAVYLLGVQPTVVAQRELTGECKSSVYVVDPKDRVCRRNGTSTSDWHHLGNYVTAPEHFRAALYLSNPGIRLFDLDFTEREYFGLGWGCRDFRNGWECE